MILQFNLSLYEPYNNSNTYMTNENIKLIYLTAH